MGIIALAPTDGLSRTTALVEMVCPVGGERFKTRLERSGRAICRRFDFKRVGALEEPPIMPECPGNGFVIFSPNISESEINRLTPWVNSSEYQLTLRDQSSYFRAAHIYQFLGRPSDIVGWHLLQATWQVETTDRDAYHRYAQAAVEAFDAYISDPDSLTRRRRGLGRPTAQFLAAELSRRMGAFEEARRRFEALYADEHLRNDPILAAVEVQLALVSNRDTEAHAASWNADPGACEQLVQGQGP